SGAARGICLQALAKHGCQQTWQELQTDYCTERASHPLDQLKAGGKRSPKPAAKSAPHPEN
ncbi:MAG: hypothetical protein KGL53_13310, partial [Elusimicrobia bacterium]|nr:hypothetical protein [Elusimicrobiota bacterium]